MTALVRASLLAVGVFVSSCARSQAPASAPNDEELEALQRDLDEGESRLRTLLARRSSKAAEGRADAQGAEAQPPATAPAGAGVEARPAVQSQSEPAATTSSGSDDCDLACRALASMRRSADGICSIAGEADSRCLAARDRVDAARAQLEGAGCQCS